MEKYNFLSDVEKDLIEAFYNNEAQREAVKKILLMGIYENGVMKAGETHNPQLNWALSLAWNQDGSPADDQVVGRNLREIAEGIKSVELAFKELSKFKKDTPKLGKKNPGR